MAQSHERWSQYNEQIHLGDGELKNMAATFHLCEDNGGLVSSRGTTQSGFGANTLYATDVNWKSVDDCTANSGTAYSAAPIVAGQNSYIKYQYGKFVTPD